VGHDPAAAPDLITRRGGSRSRREVDLYYAAAEVRLDLRRVPLEVPPRQLLDRRRERVGKLASGGQQRAEPERGVDLGGFGGWDGRWSCRGYRQGRGGGCVGAGGRPAIGRVTSQ
jgi:hypothetical protein